jgi:hypothetical protein
MAAGYDQTWMAVHEVYELYNCSIRNYYIFNNIQGILAIQSFGIYSLLT